MGAYQTRQIQVDAEQVQRDVNVSTRRGLITARAGDFIIHDALGVAEVLSGDAFFKRYELVPEEVQVMDVDEGTPDPHTPRDAPREKVSFPEHLQGYLAGKPYEGESHLTEEEAREAAKEPEKMPVVGSTTEVHPDEPRRGESRSPDSAPVQGPVKNKGGRPKGSGIRGY